jgi:hypothetical protein
MDHFSHALKRHHQAWTRAVNPIGVQAVNSTLLDGADIRPPCSSG